MRHLGGLGRGVGRRVRNLRLNPSCVNILELPVLKLRRESRLVGGVQVEAVVGGEERVPRCHGVHWNVWRPGVVDRVPVQLLPHLVEEWPLGRYNHRLDLSHQGLVGPRPPVDLVLRLDDRAGGRGGHAVPAVRSRSVLCAAGVAHVLPDVGKPLPVVGVEDEEDDGVEEAGQVDQAVQDHLRLRGPVLRINSTESVVSVGVDLC